MRGGAGGEGLYFDRCVPDALLQALEPGGPFHDLVEWAANPTFDLQLRAREEGEAHATLYLGHACIIELHLEGADRFRLCGQDTEAEESEFRPVYEEYFDPAWSNPTQLDDLAKASTGRRAYIKEAADAARPGHTEKEGGLQTSLSSWPDRFVLIDRESVVGATDKATLGAALGRAREPADDAAVALRDSSGEAWTRSSKGFGNEIDALAIDPEGRVLVIEAKDASDTGGVGWTPAQVAVYLRHFAEWVEQDRAKARGILQEMLEQRARLGLGGEDPPTVAADVELVPIILIGGELGRSAKTANRRFEQVSAALRDAGEPLRGLQLRQQADHGSPPEEVSAGELR